MHNYMIYKKILTYFALFPYHFETSLQVFGDLLTSFSPKLSTGWIKISDAPLMRVDLARISRKNFKLYLVMTCKPA